MTDLPTPHLRVGPGEAAGVTEAMIHDLVHAFYAQIRTDSELGPIFNRVIGQGWDLHLAKMCDFWSSVLLTTGRFKGNPMIAHMRLKTVRPEHFDRWLTLFRATAFDLFAQEVAELFVGRAENIARSLQLGMFFRPGQAADSTPSKHSPEQPA